MIKKVWHYKYDILFGAMFFMTLFVEYFTVKKIGLLPSNLSWGADLLLAIAVAAIGYILIFERVKVQYSRLFSPFIFLIGLSIVIALVNQQTIGNYIAGLRIYFKYLIWLIFVLIAPFEFINRKILFKSFLIFALIQIPVILIQQFVFDLDYDLISGTTVGTVRSTFFFVIAIYLIYSYFVLETKKPWLGLIGLILIPLTAFGEVKGMVYVFPAAMLVLVVHHWKNIPWKFGLMSVVATLLVMLISLPLFPDNKASIVLNFFLNPGEAVEHQTQFSKLVVEDRGEEKIRNWVEPIPEEDFEDVEELIEDSDGRSLGRMANIKFTLKNAGDLSKGGYILGAGIGATSDSSIDLLDGALYTEYPTLRLDKVPISMLQLEMGVVGIAGFAWFGVVLYLMVFKLISRSDLDVRILGYAGLAVLVTFGISLVYINLFINEGYMFVAFTILALMVKEEQKQLESI